MFFHDDYFDRSFVYPMDMVIHFTWINSIVLERLHEQIEFFNNTLGRWIYLIGSGITWIMAYRNPKRLGLHFFWFYIPSYALVYKILEHVLKGCFA